MQKDLGAQTDKAGGLHRQARRKRAVLGLGQGTLQVWVEEHWWMQGRGVGAWERREVLWASFLGEMDQEYLEKSFPIFPRAV